jgi:hypothetical protein
MINPNKLKILNEMECEYMQALIRKKSATMLQEDNLTNVFNQAKTTIELLGAILIRGDVNNIRLFTKYSKVDRSNTIKLLIRGDNLYNAWREVTRIFKTIIELEEVMKPKSAIWRIL